MDIRVHVKTCTTVCCRDAPQTLSDFSAWDFQPRWGASRPWHGLTAVFLSGTFPWPANKHNASKTTALELRNDIDMNRIWCQVLQGESKHTTCSMALTIQQMRLQYTNLVSNIHRTQNHFPSMNNQSRIVPTCQPHCKKTLPYHDDSSWSFPSLSSSSAICVPAGGWLYSESIRWDCCNEQVAEWTTNIGFILQFVQLWSILTSRNPTSFRFVNFLNEWSFIAQRVHSTQLLFSKVHVHVHFLTMNTSVIKRWRDFWALVTGESPRKLDVKLHLVTLFYLCWSTGSEDCWVSGMQLY